LIALEYLLVFNLNILYYYCRLKKYIILMDTLTIY